MLVEGFDISSWEIADVKTKGFASTIEAELCKTESNPMGQSTRKSVLGQQVRLVRPDTDSLTIPLTSMTLRKQIRRWNRRMSEVPSREENEVVEVSDFLRRSRRSQMSQGPCEKSIIDRFGIRAIAIPNAGALRLENLMWGQCGESRARGDGHRGL